MAITYKGTEACCGSVQRNNGRTRLLEYISKVGSAGHHEFIISERMSVESHLSKRPLPSTLNSRYRILSTEQPLHMSD
ncbi:hypothetical protein J6590_033722 [Homalodisca vitripennis]|nr:hypothetical protein J6590_033722 [Homalodisca vitripennis]